MLKYILKQELLTHLVAFSLLIGCYFLIDSIFDNKKLALIPLLIIGFCIMSIATRIIEKIPNNSVETWFISEEKIAEKAYKERVELLTAKKNQIIIEAVENDRISKELLEERLEKIDIAILHLSELPNPIKRLK